MEVSPSSPRIFCLRADSFNPVRATANQTTAGAFYIRPAGNSEKDIVRSAPICSGFADKIWLGWNPFNDEIAGKSALYLHNSDRTKLLFSDRRMTYSRAKIQLNI